jgi:hypothetical protein
MRKSTSNHNNRNNRDNERISYFNHERYADPTAYFAMKNLESENRRKKRK